MTGPTGGTEGRTARVSDLVRRAWGRPRAVGWWTLPLFVAVGLAGAVLATALVVVSQTQRIEALRDETAAARAELADAVEAVEEAAGEALAAIEGEVEAVRDGLRTDLPFGEAAERGVVHLRAEVPTGPPPAAPAAAPSATDEDAGAGGDGADGGDGGDADPDADADPPPEPAPRSGPTESRTATGFPVARDGGTTFLVTTFALLADPAVAGAPADVAVEVVTPGGSTTARVHSWDAEADLLLLRVDELEVAPLPWRVADRSLDPGDRLIAVGVTPQLAPVQVAGTVAASTAAALVTDLPTLALTAGGPVVDGDGEVVGVASRRATLQGDPVVVPIRRLCDGLLASCPD